MTPPSDSDDVRSLADLRRAGSRLVTLPGYFLACAVGLGLIAAIAASDGSSGLALFATLHMVLASVAAGWRAYDLGTSPARSAAPARSDRPPVTAAQVPTSAGSV